MELNELYFHGFTLYTKSLEKDKEATKLRRVIRSTDVENDELKTIRLVCKIDEDWVKNIEEGLLFVEKAVREERQFIRTEGEVVPVERASIHRRQLLSILQNTVTLSLTFLRRKPTI